MEKKMELKDYGIRVIDHGVWSDPEIEWKKSKFKTLLFNYWDCVACFDNDFDLSKEEDIATLEDWLWNLYPSEYCIPQIYYEWELFDGNVYDSYDDADYFNDARLSAKDDFVLHTASQALRQALQAIESVEEKDCGIRIYRNDCGKRTLVANYSYQGNTLKDCMCYKK